MLFIIINSNHSWLLTEIRSSFNVSFPFCHLMTSQVCFMSHCINQFLLRKTHQFRVMINLWFGWREELYIEFRKCSMCLQAAVSTAAQCCACFYIKLNEIKIGKLHIVPQSAFWLKSALLMTITIFSLPLIPMSSPLHFYRSV